MKWRPFYPGGGGGGWGVGVGVGVGGGGVGGWGVGVGGWGWGGGWGWVGGWGGVDELTHCGLVASYGDRSLGQHYSGSGNGLLPDGTKPLPEPMLTNDQ